MKNCKFIIIAAVSVDGIIGIDNEMPWRIPEDFKHFRNTTMGHMLLIGYTTYKTLPPKAFEGREYMILNGSHPIEDINGLYQFRSLNTIFNLLDSPNLDFDKIFVAGGAMVYDSLIDYCDECVITWVNKTIPNGNKRFPIDKLFTNFDVYNDQDWQTSKTGEQYKITYYKRKNERITDCSVG